MAFIEVKSLSKSHAGREVLKNVNFEVEEGSFVVLLGPSGSGKSNLLHIIAGLEPASSGNIIFDGRDITTLPPGERNLAMMFQSCALYPTMTAAENIGFGHRMHAIAKAESERAVFDIAHTLKITSLLDRKPHQLTVAERQRVSLARALVREPAVFLFDEPLSNLDAKLRNELRREIKNVHQRLGRTTIYVTHDPGEAMNLADIIVVLRHGVVQQIATPQELYNNPKNLFVADFIGGPPMNLVPARAVMSEERICVAIERSGLEPLKLPVPKSVELALQQHLGQEVVMGLRPAALTHPSCVDANSQSVEQAEFLVESFEMAGGERYALIRLGGRDAFARMPLAQNVQSGDIAPVAFQMEKAIYFNPDSQGRIG
jgi:multiple sugar transport system ATP-binding protein